MFKQNSAQKDCKQWNQMATFMLVARSSLIVNIRNMGIPLMLNFSNEEETRKIYANLSKGGDPSHP